MTKTFKNRVLGNFCDLCFVRVRGSSNGLTNHPGGDVCRGLLMHAGLLLLLLLFVVVVWCLLLLLSSPHRGVILDLSC